MITCALSAICSVARVCMRCCAAAANTKATASAHDTYIRINMMVNICYMQRIVRHQQKSVVECRCLYPSPCAALRHFCHLPVSLSTFSGELQATPHYVRSKHRTASNPQQLRIYTRFFR